MLKKIVVAAAVLAATSYALAQAPTWAVHDIGPAGEGFLSGNNVGIDLELADLGGSAGNRMLTLGFQATAAMGTIRYASDPNSGTIFITQPTTTDKEVTFVSRPRAQDAGKRFGANGALSIAGKYIGAGAGVRTDPTEVDVAAFVDPVGTQETAPGFVARLSIDLTSTGIAAGDVYAVAGTTPNNAGDIMIASGIAGVGTDWNSDALDPINQVTFSVWAVPEPASLALLVLGGLAAFRRR